jgi:hypothetical protein
MSNSQDKYCELAKKLRQFELEFIRLSNSEFEKMQKYKAEPSDFVGYSQAMWRRDAMLDVLELFYKTVSEAMPQEEGC